MADKGILYFYDIAISVCQAAILCSDGSTEFERKALTTVGSTILPYLQGTREAFTRGTTGVPTIDILVASADLITACNTVISALNGTNEQERNIISNAKGLIQDVEAALRGNGVDIRVPIAEYGKPIPEIDTTRLKPSSSGSRAVSSSSVSSGGCYIATAAYGSYDCPQVWVLRRFRDCALAKSVTGRLFTKFYYAVSPSFVKAFGKFDAVNRISRAFLDHIIERLKRQGYSDSPYSDA